MGKVSSSRPNQVSSLGCRYFQRLITSTRHYLAQLLGASNEPGVQVNVAMIKCGWPRKRRRQSLAVHPCCLLVQLLLYSHGVWQVVRAAIEGFTHPVAQRQCLDAVVVISAIGELT